MSLRIPLALCLFSYAYCWICCSLFGPKVVKPQPVAKALPALFDAKQEPVREGVKKLAVRL